MHPRPSPADRWSLTLALALLFAVGCDDAPGAADAAAPSDATPTIDADVSGDQGVTADRGVEPDAEPPTLVAHTLVSGDGFPDDSFAPLGPDGVVAGARLAVRLALPGDALLTSAGVPVVGGLGNPVAPLILRVFAADGADGAPGSELGAGAIAQLESAPISNPPMSARWATARFDPPLAVSGEAVFVAAEWPEVEPEQTAFTGLDLHPAQTGGWVFIPGEGWVALADALVPELQPAEPLAQATVSIDARLVADDPVMLSNTGLHCPDYGPGMLTNETAGGWSVTRLTPAGWPFQVEQIGYELVHRPGQGPPGCTATAPHAVVVFVSGETPADDAPLLQRFDVALDEGDVPRDHAPVRLDLDEAVTLQQGESLYVAIEMPGDAVRSCLAVCFPEQAPAANFFTQQGPGISPFVTLEEGLNLQPDHLGDPTVKAWGHPAPTDGVD